MEGALGGWFSTGTASVLAAPPSSYNKSRMHLHTALVRLLLESRIELLQSDLAAYAFDLCLDFFAVFLGDCFLQSGGSAFDSCLCVSQAQAGDFADDLDDLDLCCCVEAFQDDVESKGGAPAEEAPAAE